MARVAVLLVLLTAGCATPTPRPETPAGSGRWCDTPVVAVDDRIGAPCLENFRQAADFWRRAGAELRLATVPAEAMTRGNPALGVVQVFPAVLEPGQLGLTYTGVAGGCVQAAEIQLATCDVQVVTHELGHALGLLHSTDDQNVMYHEALGRFGLTAEQKEHVR
jgi:hypothetical protein